jgi:hypothetical protein
LSQSLPNQNSGGVASAELRLQFFDVCFRGEPRERRGRGRARTQPNFHFNIFAGFPADFLQKTCSIFLKKHKPCFNHFSRILSCILIRKTPEILENI